MLSENGIPVGINGIGGRIGSNTLRVMIEHPTLAFNVIAGNDIGLDPKNPAQNFVQVKACDTTFGNWPCEMGDSGDILNLFTRLKRFSVRLFAEKDPGKIPWGKIGVKGVAECTGVFRKRKTPEKPGYDSNLDGGAQFIAISAPAKDEVLTVVHGTHTTPLKGQPLVSAASCTSGSIAFPLKVILDHKKEWGFVGGDVNTIHAYTAGEQQLQDYPQPITDGCRRMSAGAANIIPTNTGAAKAVPKLDGIGSDMEGISFIGDAWRVPVISGSATLMHLVLEGRPHLNDVLELFRKSATSEFNGKFAVNEDPNLSPVGMPLVSSHIIRRPESAIVDVEYCKNPCPGLYRFVSWYGNEWGYVYRLVEALHEQCS